jgi:Domain of unknown function (DUF4177)
MKQVEYKILEFRSALHSPLTGSPETSGEEWEEEMNKFGKEGWELISVISPPFAILGMATFVRFIFSRRRFLATE